MNLITWLRATVVLLLLTGVVPAAHGQAALSSVPADVEQAVKARLAEIQQAAESLDPDKVFSFVLENDKGSLIQNGEFFLTRQEALRSTKQGFQGLAKVSFRFDAQHLALLSPTVVLATGHGVSRATTDDGRTLSMRFAQSVVLVLTEGQWKVLHAHRSFPPAR